MDSVGNLMTVDEVAARLKCHPLTVRRWIRTGQLEAVKIGGLIRISEEEVRNKLRKSADPAKGYRATSAIDALRATMRDLRVQLGPGDLHALEQLLDDGEAAANWDSPLD